MVRTRRGRLGFRLDPSRAGLDRCLWGRDCSGWGEDWPGPGLIGVHPVGLGWNLCRPGLERGPGGLDPAGPGLVPVRGTTPRFPRWYLAVSMATRPSLRPGLAGPDRSPRRASRGGPPGRCTLFSMDKGLFGLIF